MGIVINTNVTSMQVSRNLTAANRSINKTTERLSTGYKINHAADDAAGLSISEKMLAQVNGTKVAEDNIEHGINLLQTAEGDMDSIQDHLQRIRELTVQAANGTYSTSERNMIKDEVMERIDEITRIAQVSRFSGINLLDGTQTTDLTLQIGSNSNTGAGTASEVQDNRLNIGQALAKMTATALNASFTATGIDAAFSTSKTASDFIATVDLAIDKVSGCRSKVGVYQNRLESALSSLEIREENITSSLSTLRDADVAKEASELTKQQILQQSSASLLSQANSNPQIALSLIAG